ncbi:MAG: hypothetical protein AAB495_02155 [Patescibacteria group bacterium]
MKPHGDMKAAFEDRVEQILGDPERFVAKDGGIVVGLESEVGFFGSGMTEEEIHERRKGMIESLDTGLDIELGGCQGEFRTEPHDLSLGVNPLLEDLKNGDSKVRTAAQRAGLSVVRAGVNPIVPLVKAFRSPEKEKYRLVPDFNDAHRNTAHPFVGIRGVRVPVDASCVSAFQAFHVNLRARSLTDAVERMNRSLMISPALVALGGNARFVKHGSVVADTGMNDIRMLAWQRSHDTRTKGEFARGWSWRGGLPESYIKDMRDYFERISRHAFILDDPDHALEIATGLAWLDARIKFIKSNVIVELRSLPTQPTVEEEIALFLFYLGRLFSGEMRQERLLPIGLVRANRNVAMHEGLSGSYWMWEGDGVRLVSGTEMIERELVLAEWGVQSSAIPWNEAEPYFISLRERVLDGSPSDRLSRALSGKSIVEPDEMMHALQNIGMLIS